MVTLKRVVVATLLLFSLTAASASAAAVRPDPNCLKNSLGPANDSFAPPIPTPPVPLSFKANFFGTTYSRVWVNNNGFVNFTSPINERPNTHFDLTNVGQPVIAPFFADVDTRPLASGNVTWGPTTVGGANALCVNWVDVGYADQHVNLRNAFQLLLIDRSPVTGVAGDFAAELNYDRIVWETGDFNGGTGGFGGFPARAGYSNGDRFAPQELELPGSAVAGALLDTATGGLIHGSRGTPPVLGRYVFEFHGGTATTGAGVSGKVVDTTPTGIVAQVEICDQTTPGPCTLAVTDANGDYSASGLVPGHIYKATANPTIVGLLPASVTFTIPATSTSVSAPDIVLTDPIWVPAGSEIWPWHLSMNGQPSIDPIRQFNLTTHGCPNGTATYSILNEVTGLTRSGSMSELPVGSGFYGVVVSALAPARGHVTITIVIDCPGSTPDEQIGFEFYIDPSGRVLTTSGAPIDGATVTLYSAPSASGPFTPVPNGDPMMSPANRTNPDHTTPNGRYGWFVATGVYKVRASKAGCVDPADASKAYVESGALPIPPEVTNLDLVLKCSWSDSGNVSGTVAATLALTLGAPPQFGVFTPGVAKDYTASGTASVISTAGDAVLSVADGSAVAPGHLVNGPFSLASALEARAPGGFAALGSAALALRAWNGPVANEQVALDFRQHIGANDALRTGTYAKTVTYTLSTTAP